MSLPPVAIVKVKKKENKPSEKYERFSICV